MPNKYDTLVSMAVQKNPFEFIDILRQEAKRAGNRNMSPLLDEAACVIANLLLTDEEWHYMWKERNDENA